MTGMKVPVLEGWVTLTDAARHLKISRQAAHKMMERGTFYQVRKVGPVPVYLVSQKDLDRVYEEREKTSASA